MIFNKHSELVGRHAFLSPSKYHWINYDEEKLDRAYTASQAAQRGTELHALAHDMIRLKVKLPNTKKTLNRYVNDCIGYRMIPEQPLFYSENAFGTADAISFRRGVLRISDLKTGVTPTSDSQLLVYAAFFCLEYRFKPFEIEATELRIYQNDDVEFTLADPDSVAHIMSTIVAFDKRIRAMREEDL